MEKIDLAKRVFKVTGPTAGIIILMYLYMNDRLDAHEKIQDAKYNTLREYVDLKNEPIITRLDEVIGSLGKMDDRIYQIQEKLK